MILQPQFVETSFSGVFEFPISAVPPIDWVTIIPYQSDKFDIIDFKSVQQGSTINPFHIGYLYGNRFVATLSGVAGTNLNTLLQVGAYGVNGLFIRNSASTTSIAIRLISFRQRIYPNQ
jgi:hypothetical protein